MVGAESCVVPDAARTWAAQIYLIVGSVAVFWLLVFVVRRWILVQIGVYFGALRRPAHATS